MTLLSWFIIIPTYSFSECVNTLINGKFSCKFFVILILFLDTDVISSLKGARGEVRKKGETQYDRLKETVDKEGFDPNKTILIEVNHKGEAYIVEGNTRAALAKELGVPNIKAEIRYKNGAELVDSPFSPQNIIEKSSKLSYPEALAISKKFDDVNVPTIEAAGLTDEAIETWRKKNATSPEFRKALKGRDEELMDLAAGVKEGRVFNTTYRKRVDELRPIRKVKDVPKPSNVKEIVIQYKLVKKYPKPKNQPYKNDLLFLSNTFLRKVKTVGMELS